MSRTDDGIHARARGEAWRRHLLAAVARHDVGDMPDVPFHIDAATRTGDLLIALRIWRRSRIRHRPGLTAREQALLDCLEAARGAPVARAALLRNVFGYRDGVRTGTLATHIYRLRRKIGAGAIETTAEGYRIRM